MNKSNNNQAGFTLLELTIGIFTFTIIVAGISSMFVYLVGNYQFTFEQNRTVSEVKVVFDEITAELRETRTSEDGAYPLFAANNQELGFYADIDNDGRTERVRYYLTGSDFYKAVVEPDDTQTPYTGSEEITLISDIVNNQGNPIFYYYNGDWPGDTANNPLIQSQRLLSTQLIEVELELNTADNQQENFIVGTKVTLRNLKSNY
jgi:type II secretory pathway pseudopilin PulG